MKVQDILERQQQAAATGMSHALWAELKGDQVAIYDPTGETTFRHINEAANRVVRLLRERGLKEGDAVALLCSNRHEFVEVLAACLRGGYRLTPVNWHLNADEVEYIINDCDAKALFADTRYPSGRTAKAPQVSLRISIGGEADGFEPYETALAPFDSSDILDPTPGSTMLYTSGTTGRPKGVYRRNTAGMAMGNLAQPDDVQLCSGPAYHAAPLAFDVRSSMVMGIPLVFLDRWDSEEVLRLIQKHKVTRAHLVPIMFQRLLNLPDEVRGKYDVSSMRYIIHGAAPCPPEVKKAMIDWVGPIINEYYAGSEGGAGFVVTSEEWLTKPGTVGKLPDPAALRIVDDEGNEVPQGTAGTLYFRVSPIAPFEYYKDPAKTAAAHRDGYFTLGDVGYLDEDGYLFLTGRTAECIISGGVNIYPQEVDNELVRHPAVRETCTVGVPNDEWGEEVKAVIALYPGYEPSPELAKELLDFIRPKLAGYKMPRSV
ncbi:MAG: AMP-binding protein, partial [Caulobacteraceae bacterium]